MPKDRSMIPDSVCIQAGSLMLEKRRYRLLITTRDIENFQILQAPCKQNRIIYRVLVLSTAIHSKGCVVPFESRWKC